MGGQATKSKAWGQSLKVRKDERGEGVGRNSPAVGIPRVEASRGGNFEVHAPKFASPLGETQGFPASKVAAESERRRKTWAGPSGAEDGGSMFFRNEGIYESTRRCNPVQQPIAQEIQSTMFEFDLG
jgi:hypothetical protein